jgi:tetratricopeptide (TPR) repeat protein
MKSSASPVRRAWTLISRAHGAPGGPVAALSGEFLTSSSQQPAADDALSRAIRAHQAGDRKSAEPLYLEALRERPEDPHVLYLLGALCQERREHQRALEYLERSAALRPGHEPTQSMMGAAYSATADLPRAIACFRAAAAIAPQSAAAHFNLGRELLRADDHSAATRSFEQALAIRPDYPAAINSLAASRKAAGSLDDAITLLRSCVTRFPDYERAKLTLAKYLLEAKDDAGAADAFNDCLARNPYSPEALLLLGNLRQRQARSDEAEALYRRLVELAPDNARANNYLGAALLGLGRYAEAEERVRFAYAQDPNDPEIITNLGYVLDHIGQSREALDLQLRATAMKPAMPEAWNNLGVAQQNCGLHLDAIISYERAVELKPDFYGAKTNKAQALLSLGRLSEGWKVYRHRFDQKFLASKRRAFPYRQWDGRADGSLRLLLWTDQGLGDEVLYASMIADAQARVGRCILECHPGVAAMFQRSFPNIAVVARSKTPSPLIADFKPDVQLPLAELAELFRPDVASIPRHRGYIMPDAHARTALRAKYAALAEGRRIVGISWKSENPNSGHHKSVPLPRWTPVLRVPGVLFVSLQYGRTTTDLEEAARASGVKVVHDPEVDPLASPDLSAAQIAAMDLVISTSNTTAHFAGAMNTPVWTLVPTGAGAFWYWFLERTDSPWYPSMRLFRQSKAGEWSGAIDAVAAELNAWASA